MCAHVQVVDTGVVNEQQSLILAEARSLLVWLGSHLGLLSPQLVDALLAASFVPDAVNLTHQQSRQRFLGAAVRILGAVAEVGMRTLTPQDLRRRQALHAQVAVSLGEVFVALEAECEAVRTVAGGSDSKAGAGGLRNRYNLGAEHVACAEALMGMVRAMRAQLEQDPTPVSTALRALHDVSEPSSSGGPSSSSSSAASSSSSSGAATGACDASMVFRVSDVLRALRCLPQTHACGA